MRLVELLGIGTIDVDRCPAANVAIRVTEDQPTGPLSPKQARQRQDRKQKQLRRAAEITSTASAKAAAIRADVT